MAAEIARSSYRDRIGRSGALLIALPGAGLWLKAVLAGTFPEGSIAAIATLDLILGVSIAYLPWGQLPERATLWIPAVAFPNLAVVATLAAGTICAVPIWELVFWSFGAAIWIGLVHPMGVASLLAPLGLAGFTLAGLSEGGWRAFAIGLLVVGVGTGLAEIIAWHVTLRRRAYLRAREQARVYQSIARTAKQAARRPFREVYDAFADLALEIGFDSAGVARVSVEGRDFEWRALRGYDAWAEDPQGVARAVSRALLDDDIVVVPPRRGGAASFIVIPMARDDAVGHVLIVTGGAGPEGLDDDKRHALSLLATEAGSRIEVLRMAYYDRLTRLPNRTLFEERLREAFEAYRQHPDHPITATDPGFLFAVIFLDIDHFKFVNDAHGHRAGDLVLEECAERLRNNLRKLDWVARMRSSTAARVGGDEFAVLLQGIRSERDAVHVARRLVERLHEPQLIQGREIRTGASAGVVISHPRYERPADLLRDADIAMYGAKRATDTHVALFDQPMQQAVARRARLQEELRRAIAKQEMRLAYQPIVATQGAGVAGFEALARWHHPVEGRIPPVEFIQFAEDMGLVVAFGEWALGRAASQLADWSLRWQQQPRLYVTVNLSRRHLRDPHLLPRVRDWIRNNRLERDQLRLEVTETVVMEDLETCRRTLEALHDYGIRLSLDDFGTGHSSLSCLHQLPVDVVKLDREFVTELTKDPRQDALVRAVTGLAHELGMHVVAEGVETEEQRSLLADARVDYLQGFLLAPALEADEVLPWLASYVEGAGAGPVGGS